MKAFATAVLATCLLPQVLAQSLPDAGRTLRELAPALPPQPQQSPPIQLPVPALQSPGTGGGATVQLRGISWRGNTVFEDDELLAALGPDVLGKSYDLAGLRQLATRVSSLYRSRGFPFAQTLVVEQEIRGGIVGLHVVEGRYGRVDITGQERLVAGARAFLRDVQPGSVIATGPLERAMLVLGDTPAIRVTPSLRQGQQVGEGDLVVNVEKVSGPGGEIGTDNAGSRYTGPLRLRGSAFFPHAVTFGDRLQVSSIVTNESLRLGSVDYELPVDGSGTRLQLSYARSTYELAKEFAALDAIGRLEVVGARLGRPLVRSQRANLHLSAGLQHKNLRDDYRAVVTVDEKQSNSVPVILRFDVRDGFGGGGTSFGALTYTAGELRLAAPQRAVDAATAQKQGRFSKWNVDIGRFQRVAQDWTLYARFSAQQTDKNLESSERLTLGGVNAVRAYPAGEGSGDNGQLLQAEIRYSAGRWTPYAFHDAGRVSVNARPWDVASSATRSIAGAGVGLRMTTDDWGVDVSLAQRTRGGASQAEPVAGSRRVWAAITRRFN